MHVKPILDTDGTGIMRKITQLSHLDLYFVDTEIATLIRHFWTVAWVGHVGHVPVFLTSSDPRYMYLINCFLLYVYRIYLHTKYHTYAQ